MTNHLRYLLCLWFSSFLDEASSLRTWTALFVVTTQPSKRSSRSCARRRHHHRPHAAATTTTTAATTGVTKLSESSFDETTENQTSTTSSSSSSSHDYYSFFDQVTISVRAGSGGSGANTYKMLSANHHQQGPPDGGNGGRGGNVFLVVDPSINTLAGLNYGWRPNAFGGSGAAASSSSSSTPRIKSFRAENGHAGERQYKSGRSGMDCIIRVPSGTIVQEIVDPNDEGGRQRVDLGTVTTEDEPFVVAKGGEGGEGTGVLLKNGRGVQRPRVGALGGERKMLELTLKLVADVALVGVPNAGKSTFLASVTRAKPKIADYPFTTIIPNLGVWLSPSASEDGSGNGLVLCDVPGLIEGAARGVGLGHAFLRHVERCHVIVHLIDATSNDPVRDYEMINEEIVKYGTGQLANMPQVVVVNKMDALEVDNDDNPLPRISRQELDEKLRHIMPHSRLMWMSAKHRDGVDDLMQRLSAFVNKVKSSAR